MKAILYLISILFLVTSCRSDGYDFPKAPEQVFLTEENMPPIEYFTLEEVELPETAELSNEFYVYADTLLLTTQERRPEPYLLSVFNMKTKKMYAGYFTKGNGPGELLSIDCKFRNDEIYVYDYVRHAISIVSIDSILEKKYEYKPAIVKIEEMVCIDFIRRIKDSIVGQYVNHFYGFGCDKQPEFIKISCSDGVASCKRTSEINSFDVNQRRTFYNRHTNQYISEWLSFPYINIYDENFALQKQYIGPDSYMLDIVCQDGMLSEKDNAHTTYYGRCFQSRNHILFVNNREIKEHPLVPIQEIYCFDSTLNFVRRFKQKEAIRSFGAISFCEESGDLYLNAADKDGVRRLYKCIFDK